ncbi:MAG: tRNA preQ1(34) S-adenosylmethionine ribosyltransferase-isomerase QueA [Oscillospiraceae bacterium]|nr:tRNA preQ1(34) S-adenosylmethionine ribosyltransferase-isomerase QueA [Oscillospiraceae bacterium]MBQ6493010.1 tRNA preQ1(34) S-adenosylmethionine ribosyltransferase-isomerase QueA [Erysipelotrichaceae bacterium]
MKLEEFDFELPEELIAQHPTDKRDESRLMVLHKNTGVIEHRHFYDIIDYLKPGDVLVRNNSKVIPARLYGTKKDTGAKVEVLILKIEGDVCECLCGNAKAIKVGTIIEFSDKLYGECLERKEEGIRIFRMHYEGIFLEVLNEVGMMPTPPYIHEKLKDKDRYNNVYAQIDGSAACPTAGLHFTNELLEQIRAKGIEVLDVTLHVGLGTFKPVKEENVEDHVMHSEFYTMSAYTAERLNLAKKEGRRIIAIGTTSTRTLETIICKYGEFRECSGNTSIFIYPPYTFRSIDAQITNFHLPKSTLIMMIAALCSKEMILNAYQTAIDNGYRFFSFGDSMFIDNE